MTDISPRGLSNSGMTDLAVSPLRYWHLHINPNRPEKITTPAMAFGSALHCLILEPEKFWRRYARALDGGGMLNTAEQLKKWLTEHGIKPKGTAKSDWIAQVQAADPSVPIFDLELARFAKENRRKIIFKEYDWERVHACANSLLREPKLAEILSEGQPEAPLTAIDPETGVLLKGRLDWVSSAWTVDIKTFSQPRGKSIDKTIADAIWYDRYYRQAYFYCYLRSLQPGFVNPGIAAAAPPFVLAFVESDEPHEVRLRVLRPKAGGEVNLFWERARIEVREHIRTYAEYSARFGEKPWRDARELDPLDDSELPGVAY